MRTEDQSPRLALAQQFGMSRTDLEALVFGTGAHVPGQLGQITYDQHWQDIAIQLGLNEAETERFQRQFFAGDVLDHQLVDTIRQLKNRYQTAVLSNAFSNLRRLIKDQWQIADAFDHLVISAEIGVMKPDPKIFDHLLNVTGQAAHATVFIDDSQVNVKAANTYGIDTIRFFSPEQVLNELEIKLQV